MKYKKLRIGNQINFQILRVEGRHKNLINAKKKEKKTYFVIIL